MNNNVINILVIEDEDYDVRRIRNTLKFFEHKILIKDVVSNGNKAIELVTANPNLYDVVIMDYQIAGSIKGETLISKIKEADHSIQIIIITKMTINISDYEFANRLISTGAFWFCTKYPGDVEEFIYQPTDFITSILNAYEKRKLEKQSYKSNKKLNKNIDDMMSVRQIVGESESIRNLRRQIDKYAPSDANILIVGDTGTGKELVAYNIHYKSKRRLENFVAVNCGSLPQELIESELFGFEKGSFTGAASSKQGLFEIADNGTIFLDEVSDLPFNAQVKLLRVIQDGEIEKIGRVVNVKVKVRIIAATNKNLEDEVKANRFREDLYYRLNVIPIYVPTLSERRDDIENLLKYFIDIFRKELDVNKPEISKDALDVLSTYSWPGNVRELKNVVQRLLLEGLDIISCEDVRYALFNKPRRVYDKKDSINFWNDGQLLSLKDMEKIFKEKYVAFIRDNSRSDADASKKLGLAPPNYHRLCKELGLK
ncbi:MAG: sigma-54 dependent transcriptional regulator [Bacteroidetes bacterium]|nr:sigma-54 dependent transcriptional regulator [Bacteroidota bacterium]